MEAAEDADLVVMASHARKGIRGLLLGSQTHRTIAYGQTPGSWCDRRGARRQPLELPLGPLGDFAHRGRRVRASGVDDHLVLGEAHVDLRLEFGSTPSGLDFERRDRRIARGMAAKRAIGLVRGAQQVLEAGDVEDADVLLLDLDQAVALECEKSRLTVSSLSPR